MTTEKQQEQYKKNVNSYFMKMITNLSRKDSSGIEVEENLNLYEDMEELMKI